MWFADKGVSSTGDFRGVCLDPSELAIEAALRGVGVILESDLLAARELAEGSLVPAFEDTVSEIISYYLVYPEDNRDLPKVVAFADWITSLAKN
jgi:LysR family glycine cleavage system transcriptional activator